MVSHNCQVHWNLKNKTFDPVRCVSRNWCLKAMTHNIRILKLFVCIWLFGHAHPGGQLTAVCPALEINPSIHSCISYTQRHVFIYLYSVPIWLGVATIIPGLWFPHPLKSGRKTKRNIFFLLVCPLAAPSFPTCTNKEHEVFCLAKTSLGLRTLLWL